MIFTASLVETLGTLIGLEIQARILSVFWLLPAVLVFYNMVAQVAYLARAEASAIDYAIEIGKYLFISAFIVGAFWAPGTNILVQSNIVSAIAQADGAPVQNGEQLRASQGQDAPGLAIPQGTDLILRAVSGMWIGLGTGLNEAALRPYAQQMPLNWLMRHKLDIETVYRIRHWLEDCILDAQARLSETGEAQTLQDMSPFPTSALSQVMGQMTIVRSQGIFRFFTEPISCTAYGAEIEARAMEDIANAQTPAGRSMAALWQEELGVIPRDAARLIILRELELARGAAVEGPSMLAKYLGLRTISAGARAVGGAFSSFLGPLGSGASAAGNEVASMVDGISALMGPAILFSRYFVVFMGTLQAVANALFFPVAVIWSLCSPGHQFRPILMATAGLAAAYCLPMVFGIVALVTATIADTGVSVLDNPVRWGDKQVQILIVQAMPPIIVMTIAAILMGKYVVVPMFRRG